MMRPALACLTATLLAAAGTAALAQTAPAAPPAPPPAAAPAPAPAAPAGAAQAAPAAAPAAPAAEGQASPSNPTGEATPTPPAPPPPEALYAPQALEKDSAPLNQKPDEKATMKANGFRNTRGEWVMKLDGGKTITVYPPSVANPTVCRMVVTFDTGNWRPLVEHFNSWAYAQTPQLALLYQGFVPLDGTSTTWSWEITQTNGRRGLAFNVIKGNKLDQGNLIYTDSLPAGS